MEFRGPQNCKKSPSLVSLSDFFTKKIMPSLFYLSFPTFQQSSAWRRGQESFENGVYCSLPPPPQGRLPSMPKCPLSDDCRHFLGSHFLEPSDLSLSLPAVKLSASRCNFSLGTFSPNKSELNRLNSPAPVNEVRPSSFLPSLLYDCCASHLGDTGEITGSPGLGRARGPWPHWTGLGGLWSSRQSQWPGKVWLFFIMSCFSISGW